MGAHRAASAACHSFSYSEPGFSPEEKALAAERDQVLEEIAGRRGLETRRACCRKRRRSCPIWTGGCTRRSRVARAPRHDAGAHGGRGAPVAAGEALEALDTLVKRNPLTADYLLDRLLSTNFCERLSALSFR